MPKKTKLNLEHLSVKSFTTEKEKIQLKGGDITDNGDFCDYIDCGTGYSVCLYGCTILCFDQSSSC